MSGITAAEARANSEASTYGADEIVRQVGGMIEANSKTGVTSITHMLSKAAVTEAELEGAIAQLEGRGFCVEKAGATAGSYTIRISW